MKSFRSIYLIKILFLVIFISFFTTGQELVSIDKTSVNVLARVEVTGMLNALKLPIYAHLQDAAGQDYALVIAPQPQLEQSGALYRILDKNAGNAEYYILYILSVDKREMAKLPGNALLDDGKHIVIRSTPQQVEKLAEAGFDLQRLDHTPMVLSTPQKIPDAWALAINYDSVIAGMIGQVSQTTVETYTRNLSGVNSVIIGGSNYTIATRYTNSGAPITKATQYVYEYMQNLGLTVSYHNWSLSGYSGRNVIGELTGSTQPNEIVLVTAHLDDMPSGSTAPGADDNASGSVGVMICAELLSQQQFRRTVRFVFFTGEEQGLLGSDAYADLVYTNGNNIVAVYNMDMISYDAAELPYLRLHTRTTSNPGYSGDLAIANTFVDVVNTYSLSAGLSPVITSDGESRSDHSSFWSNGYPGILGIEDHINDITPYYHATTDSVTTLNWTYYTNFVKAAIGTASHLAIRDDGTVTANFTASPTSGAASLIVNFTDQSSGATSWAWDFGDGGASTLKNPSHTYTTAGTYTVALTASNATVSNTETKTNYITVTAQQPPVAAFTANKTTVLVGGTVSFTDQSTNTPTSWAWTFNGGAPSTGTVQNPTITYSTLGTYSVTLTTTNAAGNNTLTKTNYITVTDTIPITYCASASANITDEWIAGVVVADLNHTSSGAYYSDFTSYTTHLTKGSSASLTLTPGYSGTAYNEYWAIWIDYNRNGVFTDTGEAVYTGSGTTAKTGSFTVPTTALIGDTRMRVSMKYNAAPTSCETFSYGEVEDYTANIATGSGSAPVANFTPNKTTVAIGGTVAFTDTSTNMPTSWSWTFTGGTPSTSASQNPTITYNTAGTYTVALTATNSYGSNTNTKTAYITVTNATYCTAASTNTNDEWIARVRIGTIDKSSSKSYYSDFTATSTNLTRGASTTVTLNPGYTATAYSEAWRLFIDYNKDSDFADTGETVFSKTGTNQQSGSFAVSSTASTGATRLRVTMKYSTYTTACGSFTYGEVEDYTVNIL